MTRCIFFLFSFFLLVPLQIVYAQADTTYWFDKGGSDWLDQANDISRDRDGNIAVAGYFAGTFEIGRETLKTDGNLDIVLSKYDKAGKMIWAKRAGGPDSDRAYGVALDAKGNAFVTGAAGRNSTFDAVTFEGHGDSDIFAALFDKDGAIKWAHSFGGVAYDQGYGATTDADQNYLMAGWFQKTVVFGSDTLVANGFSDVFITKLDSSGNVLWARSAGGVYSERGHGIVSDRDGNAYIVGVFNTESTFGDFTLTGKGEDDIFVAKLNAAGTWEWVRSCGGAYRDRAFSIAIDPATNNVTIAGYVSGDMDPNSNSLQLTTEDPNDTNVLIAQFNQNGQLNWLRSPGGPMTDHGRGVSVDSIGNVFVTGIFSQSASIGKNLVRSSGNLDIFVAKYDAHGNPRWAKKGASGTGNDWGLAIAAANDGNCFIAGRFFDQAQFGSVLGRSKGGDDLFVEKIIEPFQVAIIKPAVSDSQFVSHVFNANVTVRGLKTISELRFDLFYSNPEYVFMKPEAGLKPGPLFDSSTILDFRQDKANGKIHFAIKTSIPVHIKDDAAALLTIPFSTSDDAPFDGRSDFAIDNISALDSVGKPLFLLTQPDDIFFYGIPIWPGDTNNDGEVNAVDIIPIGQFFHVQGVARRDRNLQWSKQITIPWYNVKSTYADANGDGIVDQRDIQPIGINWGNRRDNANSYLSVFSPAETAGQDSALIFLKAAETQNDSFWVDVAVDSVTDLYYVSFELVYPEHAGLEIVSVESGAFLGSPLLINRLVPEEQKIAVGLTRIQEISGVDGKGTIVRFKLVAPGLKAAALLQNLHIKNLSSSDSRSSTIPFKILSGNLTTGINMPQISALPSKNALLQNSPNPFNPATRIQFYLTKPENVKLIIYDYLGKSVRSLLNSSLPKGSHTVQWDSRNEDGKAVAGGIYFYQLIAGDYSESKKMLLLR